ncbi:helix-turn-helix domain-containing protein [Massilia sp. TWP1-3-3]|uniref:helix-turn-helix domain-containing protein n=1 Tax=Massilia sp. TWP1-3-3 TaxID=2804573 RepID=UPI003CEA0D4E
MDDAGRNKKEEARHAKVAREVGALIAKRRADSGMSQEDVAERLGIGNEAVSRLERGVVSPSIPRLFEFADIFDCRVEDLLVPASDRQQDQSSEIARRIMRLDPLDRRFVSDIVDRMADFLGGRAMAPGRKKRSDV